MADYNYSDDEYDSDFEGFSEVDTQDYDEEYNTIQYDEEYNTAQDQSTMRENLMFAVRGGDNDLVKSLLNKGVNLNYSSGDRNELPLHVATRPHFSNAEANTELLELLVNFGAPVHARDRLGVIPLHIASKVSSEYVRILLGAGSYVNSSDDAGAAIDYMHWQIPLSRRFRALKLWFVIRSFGVDGLQRHIREGVRLAKYFEEKVRSDDRFEIPQERILGLVVFRVKGQNASTELLLKRLNQSGKLHMVPASLKGKYVMRFTVTSQYTTEADIDRDWRIIRDTHTKLLTAESFDDDVFDVPEKEVVKEKEPQVAQLNTKRKDFGISLILSNVPMSPKFINGSFAAMFDNNQVMVEYAKEITNADFSGRPLRLSPRRRVHLRDQSKQQSLDIDMFSAHKTSGCYKQSSLDSKVEEILETYSNGSVKIRYPQDLSALKESEECGTIIVLEKAPPVEEVVKVEMKDASNGVGTFCKHCGHPIQD